MGEESMVQTAPVMEGAKPTVPMCRTKQRARLPGAGYQRRSRRHPNDIWSADVCGEVEEKMCILCIHLHFAGCRDSLPVLTFQPKSFAAQHLWQLVVAVMSEVNSVLFVTIVVKHNEVRIVALHPLYVEILPFIPALFILSALARDDIAPRGWFHKTVNINNFAGAVLTVPFRIT